MADDITVGSVAVDIVPDTRGFAEKLKAKLSGISAEIGLTANTADVRAQLEELTRPRSATINADADTTAAEAQLDAAARPRSVALNADTRGLGALAGAGAGVSGLGVAVAGLGPALIPVLAVVGGLAAALTAPIAVAGGGLTVGALITGAAVAKTKKQKEELKDLRDKVRSAQLAVAKASTPAGKKSAQLQLAADTAAYQHALKQLTPAQTAFIAAQDRLKKSFSGLLSSAGGAVFGPLIKGMDLLAKIMPALVPLIRGVAKGVGTLLGDLGKAASGPGFKSFIASFGKAARDSIITFGRIFGKFAVGTVSLFKAFAPASKTFTGGIKKAADAFAAWAQGLPQSKSFQSFLAYLKETGPKVASAVGHMFQALAKIGEVLAPLGGVVLAVVDGLSQMITAASPKQLTVLAGAIGAVAAALLIGGTGGTGLVVAAVLGLGTALVAAYQHSTKFRDIVQSIVGWFRDELFPALKDAAKTVMPALAEGFDNVRESVRKNHGLFEVFGDIVKGLGKALTEVVIPAVAQFYKVYLPLLGKAIGIAITVIRTLADAFLLMAQFGLSAFKLLVSAALSTFGAILTAADKALGWIPGIGDKIGDAKKAFDSFQDKTVDALNSAIDGVKGLRDELNGIKPKTVEIRLKVTEQQIVLNPSLAKPRLPLDITQRASGGPIKAGRLYEVGEVGPEIVRFPADGEVIPNHALRELGGSTGPQFNVEKVVAQDVNDFLRQMQLRARQAGIGGIPVSVS